MNGEQTANAALLAYKTVERRWEEAGGRGGFCGTKIDVVDYDLMDRNFLSCLLGDGSSEDDGSSEGGSSEDSSSEDSSSYLSDYPYLNNPDFLHEFMMEVNRLRALSDSKKRKPNIITGEGNSVESIIFEARQKKAESKVASIAGLELGYNGTSESSSSGFMGVADGRFSDPSKTPEALQEELRIFAKERLPDDQLAENSGSEALLVHHSREGDLSIASLGGLRAAAFVVTAEAVNPVPLTYDHVPDDYFEGEVIAWRSLDEGSVDEDADENRVTRLLSRSKKIVSSQASLYQYKTAHFLEEHAENDPDAKILLMTFSEQFYSSLNEHDCVLLLKKWFAGEQGGEDLRKEFANNASAYLQSCAIAAGAQTNATFTLTDITKPPQQDVLTGLFNGVGDNERSEIAQAATLDLALYCLDERQPRVIYAPERESMELSDYEDRPKTWNLSSGRVAELAKEASPPVSDDEKAKAKADLKAVADKKNRLRNAAQELIGILRQKVSPQAIAAKCVEYGLGDIGLTGNEAIDFYKDLVIRGRGKDVFDKVAKSAGIKDDGDGWYGKHHKPVSKEEWKEFFFQQLLVEAFEDRAGDNEDQWLGSLLKDEKFVSRLDDYTAGPDVDEGEVGADEDGVDANEDRVNVDGIEANPQKDVFGLCARCKYKKIQEENYELAGLDYISFLHLLKAVRMCNNQDKDIRKVSDFHSLVATKGDDVALTVALAKSLRKRGLLREMTEGLRNGLGGRLLSDEVDLVKEDAARKIESGLRGAFSAKKIKAATASLAKYRKMVLDGPSKGRNFDEDSGIWPREVDIKDITTESKRNYFNVDDRCLFNPYITGGAVSQLKSGLPIFTYDGQIGLHNLYTQVLNSTSAGMGKDDVLQLSFTRISGLKTGPSAKEDMDVRILSTKFGTSMEFTSALDDAFADVKKDAERRYDEYLIYQRRMGNLETVADIMRAKIAFGAAEGFSLGADDTQLKELREKLLRLDKVIKKCKIEDADNLDVRMEKVADLAKEFSKQDPFDFGPDNGLLKVMNDDDWLRIEYKDEFEKVRKRLQDAAGAAAAITDDDVLAEFRKTHPPAELRIADAINDAKDTRSNEEERAEARYFAAQAATRAAAKEAQRHMEEMQFSMQIVQDDRSAIIKRAKKCGLINTEEDKERMDSLLAHPWQQSSNPNGALFIHRPAGTSDTVLVTLFEPKNRDTRPTDKNIAWVHSGRGDYYFKILRVDDPNKPVRYMKDGEMVSEKLPKGTVVISEGLCEFNHQTEQYGLEISPLGVTFGTSEFTKHFEKKGLGHEQAVEEARALREVYENFQIRAVNVTREGERRIAILNRGRSSDSFGIGLQTLPTHGAAAGVAGVSPSFGPEAKIGDSKYHELIPVFSSDRDHKPLGRIVMRIDKGADLDNKPTFLLDRNNLFFESIDDKGGLEYTSLSKCSVENSAGKKVTLSVAEALMKTIGSEISEEDAKSIAIKADHLAQSSRVGISYRDPAKKHVFGVLSPEGEVGKERPGSSCRATSASPLSFYSLDRGGGRGGSRSRATKRGFGAMPAGAAPIAVGAS